MSRWFIFSITFKMGIPVVVILLFLNIALSQEVCSKEETLKRFKELVERHYLWKDRIESYEWRDTNDAISYLRSKGDRWTTITKLEEDRLWYSSAKISGIGIRWDDDGIIRRVFPDSPAQKAGLKEGDTILSINGVGDKTLWTQSLRSVPKGGIVVLKIKRDGEILEFNITKGEFRVPPVENVRIIEVDSKKMGYIALTNFTNPAVDEFKKNLEFLNSQGVDALILDLRNNGGGLISVAKAIADMFIRGQGVMFYLESKDRGIDIYEFKNGEPLFKKPVVVFVNNWTASAAELLTVLLREYYGAVVAGELTIGKYVGSSMYRLNECGEVLRLVSFEMKLPNGKNITDEKGVLPDCVIKARGEEGLSMAIDCLLEKALRANSN